MKIWFGNSHQAKEAKRQKEISHLKNWHDWFAWHPVVLSDSANNYIVWLETIQRRGFMDDSTWYWSYETF